MNRLRSIAGTVFRWSRTRSPPMAAPGLSFDRHQAPGPLPGMHEDRFVRGGNRHRVRAEDYEIEVREFPKTSFFTQQLEQERLA